MYEVGRIVVKIAGRDAGKKAVILDIMDANYALIDGETRRRKVNLRHIEPLKDSIDIKKNASRADVISSFKKLGIVLVDTKPRKTAERQLTKRVLALRSSEKSSAENTAKESLKPSAKKSEKTSTKKASKK